ncbi:MAG: VWA domain-containing protein [Saprospiraceae bacterium]|nr:VWA domain-containing protein [Lewinella sp.]
MADELIVRRTSLSENILGFCRYLRQKDFRIGPAEEADALLAIARLAPFANPDIFRLTLRAVLARTRPQQHQFDELYAAYWKELEKAVDSKIKEAPEEKQRRTKAQPKPDFQSLKNWLYGNQNKQDEEAELAAYSAAAGAGTKDLSGFSDDELEEIMRIIRRIARPLSLQYNRRRQTSAKPGNFDLRRTLRRNLRRGSDILELVYNRPKKQRPQMVLLCDVSKSMDLYSQFLVQLMYGFQRVVSRVETFVFSTSLHRVTSQLNQQSFEKTLEALSQTVPGWSGGTRIGASLQTFVEDYGRRLLQRNSLVLILSDGWDTGEPEVLEEAMRYIQKRAARVVWINPLAGSPSYEPKVRGMMAALPYIDVFAAAYDVDSLRNNLGQNLLKSSHK